jgi:uncharacterized membrane protein YphA (DoxX/SURF4 family)
MESLTGTHGDWVVALARIALGIVFFAHGAQKMLEWYGGPVAVLCDTFCPRKYQKEGQEQKETT